jgi:hypothetical protein
MAQTIRAIFLAKATAATIRGLRATILASHRLGLPPLRTTQRITLMHCPAVHVYMHERGPDDQQLADITLTHFTESAEAGLAAGRVLSRHQTQPCSKVPATVEGLKVWGEGRDCASDHWADARCPAAHASMRERGGTVQRRRNSPSVFVAASSSSARRVMISVS